MNYYNDFDKKACAWLRELINAGLIPDGVVDERSITDVTADDLCGFTQCHFFAGIGGWSRALQIAGWPEDRPVWTGSCPCQPFSTAGKQAGKSDERHLWPAFAKLIAECKPPVVFGEQVESAIKHGWIDDLQADLEREDYAVGFAVLGAHSLGAPHIRQRLYWVANAELHGHPAAENRGSIRKKQEEGGLLQSEGACDADRVANSRLLGSSWPWKQTAGGEKHCGIGGLADSDRQQRNRARITRAGWGLQSSDSNNAGGMANADGEQDNSTDEGRLHAKSCCKSAAFRVANADGSGLQPGERDNPPAGYGDTTAAAGGDDRPKQSCQNNSVWGAADWLFCRDGKWRPVESGTFPLADGIPGRVGLLRGYGNAIVPQVAAEFITAFMEVE
jgi:DNA (cytosine-5)-methyltransferase 1